MQCPTFAKALIVADNDRLAAQLSAIFARPGTYVPVMDGPRLQRPDGENEVVRRNNAAARVQPRQIFLAGLSRESELSFRGHFPQSRTYSVPFETDLRALSERVPGAPTGYLDWGCDNIGLGLLQALYSRQLLRFHDTSSASLPVRGRSTHLVVCSDCDPLGQVIAANYAYSLGAGLCMIPATNKEEAKSVMERFYTLYDNRENSPTEGLAALTLDMRRLCGPLPLDGVESLTFITDHLPFGFAFGDIPSSHLFTYPDLGIAVINGFAMGQKGARGVEVAVLVDPRTTDAPEIPRTTESLYRKGVFVRGYNGEVATVRNVQQEVELFPYDLLLVATHCGDPPGWRWTYEFQDSEGIDRVLVVDVAASFSRVGPDLIHVVQQDRFVSLDGVDWNDPEKKKTLYVGKAILDFTSRTEDLQPTIRESIDRVVGSKVLKMYDHNYLPLPKQIALQHTPIIINNACGSWDELAATFLFGNARAYVGTLYMISTTEASEVVCGVLDRHFNEPLALAFWRSQQEAYGDQLRRPYVVTGVFTQTFGASEGNIPAKILEEMRQAKEYWASIDVDASSPKHLKRDVDDALAFYSREIRQFETNWEPSPP